MKDFFDSSILVAALCEDESHHAACSAALNRARGGCYSLHSLAEIYNTLTGKLGIPPADARQAIDKSIVELLDPVTLSLSDYLKAIQSAVPIGSRGAAIYDLLLLASARKAGAERIYTLNLRHFHFLAPDLKPIIVSP
ncbi:MAG: PIN domain-containing protein [Verrucomicrobia bacterium]|nr:PIN domain-containing protein [Verrucomicrobiota bacterium]